MFAKVTHLKTADAVVDQIEELILKGILRSGDRLPAERELAVQTDVSRPVVRSALKVLEERGLVEARQGGGTFVCELIGAVFSEPVLDLIQRHPSAIDDYLDFRRRIEGQTAAMAAERAAPSDLTILRNIAENMREARGAEDTAKERMLDVEFHQAIGEAAHNVILMHTLRSCYRLLESGVFWSQEQLYAHPTAADTILTQHLAIAEAIEIRDPAAAQKASEDHIDYVRQALIEAAELDRREAVAGLRRNARNLI